MKRFHLIFGLIVLLIFLLTGQYMDKYHNHLVNMPDGPRLLYRSRHIFILLAGLLNLILGVYFVRSNSIRHRILQIAGSTLIMAATALFVMGFFYEPKLKGLATPLSHWAAYTIVAGTFLHLFGVAGQRRGTSGGKPETICKN